MRAFSCAIATALVLALALAAPAAAQEFAPLNQPGPKLKHDRDDLRASLSCTRGVRNAKKPPVLLLAGTTVTPDENFSWNWMPALRKMRFPYCTSTPPDPSNMDDIQTRGEYVVYAIRRMYRMAGRKIAIYGHSQGGMVGRWALRFWPDTRKMVADIVGAAPSNRGTDLAHVVCVAGCSPAFWQQRSGSDFLRALNSRTETFRGVSYTNIYTRYDEVVIPNGTPSGNSALSGPGKITNVAVQDICPADVSEHLLLGTVDLVAWTLFIDAVTRPGPADPSSAKGACSGGLMPGVDKLTYATDLAAAAVSLAKTIATYPFVDREPPLRGYVYKR